MTCAYDELYLSKARRSMGVMLDFAVNVYGIILSDFYQLFLNSAISTKMERGNSAVVAGKSGIELAYDIIDPKQQTLRKEATSITSGKSKEYWTGWALAYFQWKSALSYSQIQQYISIDEIKKMYTPYHEMDILQFVDKMGNTYNERKRETNLKLMRTAIHMSQKDLAQATGIPLRMIQQYEQRQKNINRASFDYIISLSNALHCDVKALMEIEVA